MTGQYPPNSDSTGSGIIKFLAGIGLLTILGLGITIGLALAQAL